MREPTKRATDATLAQVLRPLLPEELWAVRRWLLWKHGIIRRTWQLPASEQYYQLEELPPKLISDDQFKADEQQCRVEEDSQQGEAASEMTSKFNDY